MALNKKETRVVKKVLNLLLKGTGITNGKMKVGGLCPYTRDYLTIEDAKYFTKTIFKYPPRRPYLKFANGKIYLFYQPYVIKPRIKYLKRLLEMK